MATPGLRSYLLAALAGFLTLQAAVGFFILSAGLEIAEQGAREGSLASAQAVARSVEVNFSFARGLIANGVRRPGLIRFLEQGDQAGILGVTRATYDEIPCFEVVYVTDTEGRVLQGFPEAPAWVPDFDEVRAAGHARRSFTSSLTQGSLSDALVIVVAQPILGSGGELLGVLIGEIGVRKITADLLLLRYGKQGYARLLARDGRILADPNGAAGVVEGLREALSAGESWAVYDGGEGDMVASLVPSTTQGWTAAVIQPESQATVRASYLRDLTLVLFSGAASIAFGIGLFVVRRVVRPLRAVTEAAAEITSGNFKKRAPTDAFQELSELGRAFNQMTDRLTGLLDEVKQQNQENARLCRQAQEAVRLRDEFLSVASHELYTPLTSLTLALQAISQLAASGAPLEPRVLTHLVTLASRQGERLTHLNRDLLDVSRIEAGRLPLEFVDVDLCVIVRDVVERFEPNRARARCPLSVECAAPVVGHWDRARLDQVITNLLSNAIKFGAGKPIELSVSRESGTTRLMVRDHGIGIDPARQACLFERFERGVSARHYGGFGLGLYISRRIVEAHSGSIRVESRPSEGATFIVELPCIPTYPTCARPRPRTAS
jgi:signal transduction histidine kinase